MSTTLDATGEHTAPNDPGQNDKVRPALAAALTAPGFWRPSAPAEIAASETNARKGWSKHLQTRRTPQPLDVLCGGESPLKWGIVLDGCAEAAAFLLELCQTVVAVNVEDRLPGKTNHRVSEAVGEWTGDAATQPQSIESALSALAVAHLLADRRVALDSDLWWRAADLAAEIAVNGSSWECDEDLEPRAAIAQQLHAGELPLTLSYLFPEISPLYDLRDMARLRLSDGVEALLNGHGLWHGALGSTARPLIACWTRCRAMGDKLKRGAWSAETEDQFRCLVTTALQWSAPDGTQWLVESDRNSGWTPSFMQSLLRLGGDRADWSAARELFGKKLVGPGKSNHQAEQPETADHCEWSGLALLRTDWDRKGATIAVDYSGEHVRLEVALGSQRLLAGAMTTGTIVDGQRVGLVGDWEEVCWESDDDIDYVELSIDLSCGGTIERQILLAHNEQFCFLADNVKADHGNRIEHSWQIPVGDGISAAPAQDTCETLLSNAKPRARLFPLALSEWRTDSSAGKMETSGNVLRIAQQQPGSAMTVPLFIDLKQRRLSKPCTWRQLTVAEALAIVARDVAVAYRVQCNKDQYVFYRSQTRPANRTFIGQNIACECLVAKFLPPYGEIEQLLEIEAS